MSNSEIMEYTDEAGQVTEQSVDDLFAGLDTINLADIAEIEGRFKFPKGEFRWEVKSFEKTSFNTKEDGVKAVIQMVVTCIGVHQCIVPGLDNNTLVGKEFEHTFWLGNTDEDIREGLGRMRFTMRQAGLVNTGGLSAMIEMNKGKQFDAKIKHKKNNGDIDNPYINMDDFKAAQTAIG